MATITNKENFRKNLVDAVKDAGLDLIDNAEEFVGEADLLSSMTITIRFDPDFNMRFPVINIDKDYLSKAAYDRYVKGEE